MSITPTHPSGEPTGRWAPHEVAVVALGFVLPLGGDTRPAFLNADSTKFVVLAAAVVLLLFNWLGPARKPGIPSEVRRAAVPLTLYTVLLAGVSISWQLSSTRYQLLAAFVVAVAAFFLCEQSRPGSFADITYRVGALHVLLIVVNGDMQTQFGNGARLGGAISPVSVGFEATLVSVLAVARWRRREGRWPWLSLAVAGVSVYAVYASFSRAALISFAAGVVAVLIYRRPKRIVLKVTVAAVGLTVGYLYLADWVVGLLGRTPDSGLDSASGRYTIWEHIWVTNEHWIRGHGFAALRYLTGPDAYLFEATARLPAENALLQAVVMGGVAAGLLWLGLFYRGLKVLWRARTASGGMSLFFAFTLLVNAVYSNGLSGSSAGIWWLLAAFSVATGAGVYADPRVLTAPEDPRRLRAPA